MDLSVDQRVAVHVARQPILQPSGEVYGYELLYRATAGANGCSDDLDLAGARVLTDVMLNLGLDTLTNNRLAFINLSRRLLLAGAWALAPRPACVLELHEDIVADEEVIQACRQLFRDGYTLALDDYAPDGRADALLPFAKFVKVDMLSTTPAQRREIASRLLPRGVRLVAERVETQEQADEARAMGYRLAQGYFFCRPTTFGAGALPPKRMSALHLLATLNNPDVTIAEVDEVIKRDAALSYRVLRSVNSAAFGIGREVHSIRDAIVYLGLDQIRNWASVWALAGVDESASETVTLSMLRARYCEFIGRTVGGSDTGAAYFVLGLCSLLDVILDRPMAVVLEHLPLPARIRDALRGMPNTERAVLDTAIAHERADWEGAAAAAALAGIPAATLPEAYADAVRWSHHVAQHAAA